MRLQVDDAVLEGRLRIPPDAAGVVVLVDSGWGVQYATRENRMARRLRAQGMGTLLVELFTVEEDRARRNRVATDELVDRLVAVIEWLGDDERTAGMTLGLFGVGTGAATVVVTARHPTTDVGGVVTLDGRFDPGVEWEDGPLAPTLLVVGRGKEELGRHNRRIRSRLPGEEHHCTVLRSGNGSSGDDADGVAPLASNWFETHLGQ